MSGCRWWWRWRQKWIRRMSWHTGRWKRQCQGLFRTIPGANFRHRYDGLPDHSNAFDRNGYQWRCNQQSHRSKFWSIWRRYPPVPDHGPIWISNHLSRGSVSDARLQREYGGCRLNGHGKCRGGIHQSIDGWGHGWSYQIRKRFWYGTELHIE